MSLFGSRHDEDGFTLLEALIALIVLAVSTTMFARSVSDASAQLSGSDRLIAASHLGYRLMVEAEAFLDAGATEGLDPTSGLHWHKTIGFINDAGLGEQTRIGLVTVEISVGKGKAPVLQFQSSVFVDKAK